MSRWRERLRHACKVALQVGLLTLAAWAGNWLTAWLHVPLPGSVVAMVAVFVLLRLGWLRVQWVEAGAAWLLADMLLFFFPAAVGIMQYGQILRLDGVRIIAVILLSTVAVMAGTGLLTDYLARRRERAGA